MEIIYANSKIEVFIRKVNKNLGARIEKTIDILERCGNNIEFPHSKNIGRGLFELRTEGNPKVRMIFIFHENRAYLLHIFMKKEQKIRKSDIDTARRVRKIVLE